MHSARRLLPTAAIAVTTGLMLGGCAGPSSGPAGLSIVTSTNVYADIVSQVVGDAANVTAIIDDPNQDPHSYEATTRDRLMLSKADLVVVNGGGYDSFMTTMLEASDAQPEVIDVVAISGLAGSDEVSGEAQPHSEDDGHAEHSSLASGGEGESRAGHEHGEFNEHLWYSVATMTRLVDVVSSRLGEVAPESGRDFAADAQAYARDLGTLQARIDEVRTKHEGEKAAATEPVPLRLFADMGLETVTSPEFLAAVEEGSDVPPLVLRRAEDQISSGEAVLLGYNTQAAGPQAEQLKAVAEDADVPVVDLAETMPEDAHYTDWMGAGIDAISAALDGHEQ